MVLSQSIFICKFNMNNTCITGSHPEPPPPLPRSGSKYMPPQCDITLGTKPILSKIPVRRLRQFQRKSYTPTQSTTPTQGSTPTQRQRFTPTQRQSFSSPDSPAKTSTQRKSFSCPESTASISFDLTDVNRNSTKPNNSKSQFPLTEARM